MAIGLLVWQLWAPWPSQLPVLWSILLAVGLVALAFATHTDLRIGSHGVRFVWSESAFAAAACMLPAHFVAPAMVLGATAAAIGLRTDPFKALFNVAATAVASTAAAASLRDFYGASLTAGLAERLVLAIVVYSLLHYVLTWIVVAIAQGIRVRHVAAEGLLAGVAVTVGNLAIIGVGATALVFGHARPWLAAMIMAVVALLLYAGNWLHLFVSEEDRAWRRLNDATARLDSFNGDTVFGDAATDAAILFRADSARIELRHPDGRIEEFVHFRAGTGHAVMTLERSLRGLDGEIGTLTLGFSAEVKLRDHELRALDLFSHAVAATVRSVGHIAEARAHAALRESQALIDIVTGLSTRQALVEHAQNAIADGHAVAVVVIGVEHFGDVNTMLGPDAADDLLRGLAARLRAVGRSGDMIGRLHGAEFAVVLHGLRSLKGVTAAANELIAVMAEPITVSSIPIVIEARAGYAHAPGHGDDAVTLLRRARLALFDARNQERASAAYQPALDASSDTGLQVIADLRRAIDNNELVLHYQPKFELRGGRPAGAEALVRWQHPERGMVPPMDFIGTVERSPLIRDFTLHVLDAAIAECASWDTLAAPMPVAVNLSPRSLLDPDLPEQVERVLHRHGLPSHRLILEMTETVAVSDLEIVGINLSRLRAMGIQLSLDDFGTGYSSISLLTRQTVDELKIDREFVSKMTPGSRAATLVENLIKLAHGFDLTVVAEGVENAEQEAMLRAFGCDHAQGYHLARPMPAADIRAVFAKAVAESAVTPTGTPTGTIDGQYRDRSWKDRWTTNPPA
jgi:diguanylate cyclase (GGDEF)-like protein